MTSVRLFLSLSAIFLLVLPASANPLIALPAGDMNCSVAITPKTIAAPPPPPAVAGKPQPPPADTMKSVSIIRKNNIRRDLITWSNGSTSETWIYPEYHVMLVQRVVNGSDCLYDVTLGSGASSFFMPLLLQLDDASLSWISSQNRTPDSVSYRGKPTIHYQSRILLPKPPSYVPTPDKYAVVQVWLDPKTLVPIAFDDGDNTYDLTFADPPTDPLVAPPRIAKEADLCRRSMGTAKHR